MRPKLFAFPAFLLLLQLTITAHAQEILFEQDYKLKSNPFNDKMISGQVVQDPKTGHRLIVISGGKDFTFYHTDENWKLIKSFDSPLIKESGFSDDHFKIVSAVRNGDAWTVIVSKYTVFTAETVDIKNEKHTVAGRILEDKHKDNIGLIFTDNGKSYNMYLTRDNAIKIASIEGSTVKTIPLALSSSLPLKKDSKLKPADLYKTFSEIDTLRNQMITETHKKVHLYKTPQHFIFGVIDEEPVAEISYYDKTTGQKVKTDLFSVESLLPAASGQKLNNSFLVYDNKVWVLSAYKNGGVLGIFDQQTKSLLQSIKYDDKSSTFSYGPVMYKTSPGMIATGSNATKDKVNDISMDEFAKKISGQTAGLYVHPFNENEYAVSIASYQVISTIGTNTISNPSAQVYDPSVYESAAAGVAFKKDGFGVSSRKTTFNEVNYKNASSSYKPITTPQSTGKEPEHKNKKAYVIKEQFEKFNIYTIYYYQGKVKISLRVSPVDLSQFNLQ